MGSTIGAEESIFDSTQADIRVSVWLIAKSSSFPGFRFPVTDTATP